MDDTDATISPEAKEVSDDGIDQDWGKRMGDGVASGSTRWEVFRIV